MPNAVQLRFCVYSPSLREGVRGRGFIKSPHPNPPLEGEGINL